MTISTEYLKELLANISQYPWKYEFTFTKRYAREAVEEKYIHQISNDYGVIVEQTGRGVNPHDDTDWELAALAPTLAVEVLKLRGIIEDCEKSTQPALVKPEHPEYLETLEDYEEAPLGTIVEIPSWPIGRYLVKRAPFGEERWYTVGSRDGDANEVFAGVSTRVLYWPEKNDG